MYGKSNMETYITICKIDSQWEFAVWLRELKQGLCINLEGQDREEDEREVQEGEGIYVYLWLIHVDVWKKTTKFCKAIILQLKNKKKKFKGCICQHLTLPLTNSPPSSLCWDSALS